MKIQPIQITPYVFFGGRATEAAEFYKQALGAEIITLKRHNESPDPHPEGVLDPNFQNNVLHGHLKVAGTDLFISDGGKPEDGNKSGFMLAVTVRDRAEIDHAFNALAQGGSVIMPPGETFFSPYFAMVNDKFDLGWMFILDETQ